MKNWYVEGHDNIKMNRSDMNSREESDASMHYNQKWDQRELNIGIVIEGAVFSIIQKAEHLSEMFKKVTN